MDSQLPDDLKRNVTLARYWQDDSLVPESEAADILEQKWGGLKKSLQIEDTRISPAMADEMRKRGFSIVETGRVKYAPRYSVSPDFAMDGTVVDSLPAHLREDGRAIVAERANTPAWMADPDGTPTDLSERDWLRREAERRHGASVAPHGVQKQAGVAYPDASSEIVRFSIGARRREEYRDLLARKRPDLDAEAVLAELDKFDDPKKEKIALHWVVRGTIRLPEDAYKIDDALDVAGKAKVDPFSYRSPEELFLAHKEFKPSARPIDPATVPELSDARDEGDGIVSYLVQDDRQGQAAMRRIIDTHWGEDANPWCLLAKRQAPVSRELFNAWENRYHDWEEGLTEEERDDFGFTDLALRDYYAKNVEAPPRRRFLSGDEGGLDDAWHYWNNYSALPKRVAFKDGRLLSFMATDAMSNPQDAPALLERRYEEETGKPHAINHVLTDDFKSWKRSQYHEE